jgi:hypothetical protein
MISSKDKTKSIKNLTPKDIKELNFENTMRVVGTFDDFNDKERRTY